MKSKVKPKRKYTVTEKHHNPHKAFPIGTIRPYTKKGYAHFKVKTAENTWESCKEDGTLTTIKKKPTMFVKLAVGTIRSFTRGSESVRYRIKTLEGWKACTEDGKIRSKSEAQKERAKETFTFKAGSEIAKTARWKDVPKVKKNKYDAGENPIKYIVPSTEGKVKVRLSSKMEVYVNPSDNNPAHIRKLKAKYNIPV